MPLDDNRLNDIFDAAAREQEEAQKPTLAKVLDVVADKFTAEGSFKISQFGNGISIHSDSGPSIQVDDNGDGTFCVNHNRQKMFNKTSLEQTIAKLGSFYGQHKTNPDVALQQAAASKLDGIFDAAAKETAERIKQEEEAKNPLLKIWTQFADRFTKDSAFTIDDTRLKAESRPSILVCSSKDLNNNVDISYNGNGTFCINGNGQEMYNELPAEEVVKSLGRFHAAYKTPAGRSPGAPRP